MLKRNYVVPFILYFFSLATIMIALVQAVQIPFGALPQDSSRLAATPLSHFIHASAGALFGLLGPLQFGRVLAKKYGRAHWIMGRVFVGAGGMLVLSSFSLLWHFPKSSSVLVSGGRFVFAVGLGVCLTLAMQAIRRRKLDAHRDWMIRAYAVGIGATAVSMLFIPVFAITGAPPMGMAADVAFIGAWAFCIVLVQWLVSHLRAKE